MENSSNTLKDFVVYLEKPSKKWWMYVIGLSALVLIALIAAGFQIVKGQYITGMNDNVVWGVYEVNFIFVLGFSYAAAIISSIFQLAQIKWGKPMIRILEMTAVISLIIGPIYVLLCTGRIDRAYHLITFARLQSPMIWDFIAIMTDLFLCLAYLYLTHIKDFARLRDYADLKVSPLHKKLYSFLALNYKGSPEQEKNLNSALNILAAIIIPTAIIAYSLAAWLFGMNQRAGWHSSLMAPYFVLTAVYSGLALVTIILYIYRKTHNLYKYITNDHFNILGFLIVMFSLLYGYFSFSDYITMWYNQDLITAELLHKLGSLKEYGWLTAITVICTTVIPLFFIGLPFFRSEKTIFISSIAIIIGFWLKRYLIIVPTLETTYVPTQDMREGFMHYSASFVEWIVTIGGFAAFVLFFVVMSKFVPIISVSELEEDHKPFRFFFKTRSINNK